MKVLRIAASLVLGLGLVSSVFADPTDPGVLFNTGGHHSTDILPSCALHPSCIVQINDPIVNGGGTFDIHNKSGKNITSMIFFIPTLNFDQVFFSKSNLFLNTIIVPDIANNQTDVYFFSVGNGPDAFFQIPPPEDGCQFCAPGFVDGSNANPPEEDPNFNFHVDVFFGKSSANFNHPGLLNGQEGILGLQASVPEPGTFLMLISVVGFVAGARKFSSR